MSDNDISIDNENEGYLELSHQNHSGRFVTAQYLMSLPVNRNIYGSKNNTPIDTVARFLIPNLGMKSPPNFFILPFHNPKRGKLDFAVVPSQIVIERKFNKHQSNLDNTLVEIVFWLLDDDCLYDCTNISIEGEWFFLSKGRNGRMADYTERNYTPFLNNWRQLFDI